ncbi:MAG: hypothetical protein Q7U51_02160, partial [Methanoregula sp.]|nr:hypothetical protein [Methanoregula sp.]
IKRQQRILRRTPAHEQMIPRPGQRHIQQTLPLGPLLLALQLPQHHHDSTLRHLVIVSGVGDPDPHHQRVVPNHDGAGAIPESRGHVRHEHYGKLQALGRMDRHDVDGILRKGIERGLATTLTDLTELR